MENIIDTLLDKKNIVNIKSSCKEAIIDLNKNKSSYALFKDEVISGKSKKIFNCNLLLGFISSENINLIIKFKEKEYIQFLKKGEFFYPILNIIPIVNTNFIDLCIYFKKDGVNISVIQCILNNKLLKELKESYVISEYLYEDDIKKIKYFPKIIKNGILKIINIKYKMLKYCIYINNVR